MKKSNVLTRCATVRFWSRTVGSAILGLTLAAVSTGAQQIKWGLTVTNINNPIPPIIVTNGDGSISITAGGGDTYGAPDSFTYAYQQVTGDFDIAVQVVNVTATDPLGQDSPKGSLMVRTTLDGTSYDYQINALPLAPSGRNGQIESIGRLDLSIDTDDLPGKALNYGGDTTDYGYCTYPDVWLRMKRQGDKLMSFFATTNITDYPGGASPMSTNGWQLLTTIPAGTNFPKTLYVGLSTVAHNSNIADTTHTVTSTYANYGPTGTPHSTASSGGTPVPANEAPGPFPNTHVLAANISGSVSSDGMGYPPNIVQSSQGTAQPIIWNTGDGFGGVTRDIIASITSQSPDGFCFARYQAGAFDFMLSPRDPVAALQNLGPYSNPLRERFGTGDVTVPASQAWVPSPTHGFVFATVNKTGQVWNDQSPFFYAAAYVQLDGVATGEGYDMIGGHFRGGQFYTRTTKLVTGALPNPASQGPTSGSLQRCAIPISLAWFPYDQGWIGGYFDDSHNFDLSNPGRPYWKHGDGWALQSGTALKGAAAKGGQTWYNSPTNLLTWVYDNNFGTYDGLATLSLPGVNSLTDGMLLTVGNDENNGIRGPQANNAALPDGSGWYVAVRDIETSKADPTVYAMTGGSDAGSSFSFLYIPWNADNLVAGYIRGTNAAVIHGAGNFTVQRLSTGRYALTIPGKTAASGALLLQNSGYLAVQPTGYTNVVDTSYLSYEYGGTNTPANAFIIQALSVVPDGGEGVVTPRDADFNFVWVDFQNPLAPPGTVPPVLSITRSGNNVVVSWTNGPGFVLQKTSSLSPVSWTNLGTQNPQTIPMTAGPQFYRVVSP
ncbi:MAG TPA: hypothetical protein VG167_03230 [Verrucomicrobiae bacterium]|nr:hypothetical protein [Verrucomicrobiae bacterium]